MFELFTEKARRAIFFARYEASVLGSGFIEIEHLLLGLIREDRVLIHILSLEAKEAIRKQIEEHLPRLNPSIPTSTDLPLARDSQRVLSLGAEESEKLAHKVIDTGHLVLGLLRLENGFVTGLMSQHGIEYGSYRETIQVPIPQTPGGVIAFEPEPPAGPLESIQAAPLSLQSTLRRLQGLMDATLPHLAAYSDADRDKFLKRKRWTRKEALGHLVDYASSHQQWLARAITEPNIVVPSYPQDSWVSAQHYGDFSWLDLIDLWALLNRLLVHVLTRIPEQRLNTPCRVGFDEPMLLSRLIERYVDHCEDVVGQILARL
jgi:hypothetical protein